MKKVLIFVLALIVVGVALPIVKSEAGSRKTIVDWITEEEKEIEEKEKELEAIKEQQQKLMERYLESKGEKTEDEADYDNVSEKFKEVLDKVTPKKDKDKEEIEERVELDEKIVDKIIYTKEVIELASKKETERSIAILRQLKRKDDYTLVSRKDFVEYYVAKYYWDDYSNPRFTRNDYYSDTDSYLISFAAHLGLTTGDDWDNFYPERPITREEAAVFLTKLIEHKKGSPITIRRSTTFHDVNDISSWAWTSVQKMYTLEIFIGTTDHRFLPTENLIERDFDLLIDRAETHIKYRLEY